MKSGSLNLLEPSGPVQGLLYLLPSDMVLGAVDGAVKCKNFMNPLE
jgi:hypothetical protein